MKLRGKTPNNFLTFQQHKKWEKLVKQAKLFERTKKYKKAVTYYDNALKIKPWNMESWKGKADSLFELEKFHEAIQSYKTALKLNPKNLEILTNQGIAYYNLRNYISALKIFDIVLKKTPNDPVALHFKAHCFQGLGKNEKAVLYFTKELQKHPRDPHSLFEKASSLQDVGKYDEAINYYEKSLKIEPKNVEGWANKGSCLYELDRYRDAIFAFDRALKLDPEDGFSMHLKAHVLQDLGNHQQAIICFKKELKIESKHDDHCWESLGNSYLILDEDEKALKCFKTALKLNPDNKESKIKKGYLLARLGKYYEAVRCYEQISKRKSSMPRREIMSRKQKEVKMINHSKEILNLRNDVFIVHGHDLAAKESVSRFILGGGLNPIILEEESRNATTIIESFENESSKSSYAVVLLTPDDIISGSKDTKIVKRARQNVILELGAFIGKVGRKQISILYKKDTEIPSDLHGIKYIELDDAGGWKMKLAKDMIHAGLKFDLSRAF